MVQCMFGITRERRNTFDDYMEEDNMMNPLNDNKPVFLWMKWLCKHFKQLNKSHNLWLLLLFLTFMLLPVHSKFEFKKFF